MCICIYDIREIQGHTWFQGFIYGRTSWFYDSTFLLIPLNSTWYKRRDIKITKDINVFKRYYSYIAKTLIKNFNIVLDCLDLYSVTLTWLRNRLKSLKVRRQNVEQVKVLPRLVHHRVKGSFETKVAWVFPMGRPLRTREIDRLMSDVFSRYNIS